MNSKLQPSVGNDGLTGARSVQFVRKEQNGLKGRDPRRHDQIWLCRLQQSVIRQKLMAVGDEPFNVWLERIGLFPADGLERFGLVAEIARRVKDQKVLVARVEDLLLVADVSVGTVSDRHLRIQSRTHQNLKFHVNRYLLGSLWEHYFMIRVVQARK